MADIYDKFDTSLIRTFVYAKAIALEENISEVTPEIFAAGMLLSGPNKVTQILSHLNVNINVLVYDLKKIINKQSNKEHITIGNNIAFSSDSKLILNRLIELKNQYGDKLLRVEHLLIDLCDNSPIGNKRLSELSKLFNFATKDAVTKAIKEISKQSNKSSDDYSFEDVDDDESGDGQDGGNDVADIGNTRQSNSKGNEKNKRNSHRENIFDFCIDLTKQAREKKLDVVVGRDKETEQIITTLCRRKKNNPILIGKPGVGKTSIVEGVAQRISSKSVPTMLVNSKILLLSLSSVVAGTQYRGQFEKRMTNIVKFFRNHPDYICFIDEIHTIMGAGNSIGGLDIGNILKPALARNDFKCIGATTEDEYNKHFLKDGALERRFQKIYVSEPSVQDTIKILIGTKDAMEMHYACHISDDAIESAVKLSDQYIVDKNFPDKAIDLLDDACARFGYANSPNIIVTKEHVAKILSEHKDIPYDMITASVVDKVTSVSDRLKEGVVGQLNAIDAICRTIKHAYIGIRNTSKPICTLVLAGASGTGKTYVVEKLSNILFHNKDALIRINLGEFSESHSVAKLIGSPPGYVGFGDQNQLTDRVSKQPYSLVLLDNFDKAHPDVLKIFTQAFSHGFICDRRGCEVSFRQSIFILTTNKGFDSNSNKPNIGFGEQNNVSDHFVKDRIVKSISNTYGVDFVNNVTDFIIFNTFSDKEKIEIAKIMLEELSSKIKESHEISITYDKKVLDKIVSLAENSHSVNAGAIDDVIQGGIISSVVVDCIVKNVGKKGFIQLLVNKDSEILSVFKSSTVCLNDVMISKVVNEKSQKPKKKKTTRSIDKVV
jgi:ATP-dependent Clp protease ATP-binding subunit ClpC